MSNKPPIEVPQGAIRLNTDSQKLEFFAQDRWYEIATDSPTLDGGGRGLVGGGNTPSSTNIIQFITISTLGNSTNFGDLTGTRQSGPGATGNSTGETARVTMTLSNVNSTTIATYIHGFHYSSSNNGNTVGRAFNAGQDVNSYNSVVNGIKFTPGSGNIIVSYFKLYGLT